MGFAPGPIELIIICLVFLLLFGNKLPGMMRSVGTSIVEFKKGMKGIENQEDEDKERRASEK